MEDDDYQKILDIVTKEESNTVLHTSVQDINKRKEDLLNERRVELAFENQRFFDLLRLGEAQNVLSAYATENGYNFTSTTLLLPIPSSEINLSKGLLEQNPGY